MKFLAASSAFAAVLAGTTSCLAFAPPQPSTRAFAVVSQGKNSNVDIIRLNMADGKTPFFATDKSSTESKLGASPTDENLDSMSVDDEVEKMVEKEMSKKRRVSNLRSESGVEYAPWMKISEEDEAKIRQMVKEKTEARRRRQEQERKVSGNLLYDSQAQELSGTGLNYKVIGGDSVELTWATQTETDTAGFIVKRRPAKTDDFDVLASYQEEYGSLTSQGTEGGIYRYLDTGVTPGGWVYRVSECDKSGSESDLCQCLVEVETEDEQRAALIAGAGIAVIAVAAVLAGIMLDPMNGY